MRKIYKIFFVFCALLCFACTAYPQQGPASRWQELTQEAYALYQQGDIEQAVKVTEEALASAEEEFGPESIQAAQSMGNLGALYGLLEKRQESWELYKKSAEIRDRYNAGVPDDIQRAVFYQQVNSKK